MRNLKFSLVAVLIALSAIASQAQGFFDFYAGARVVVIGGPTVVNGSIKVTNNPVDIRPLTGVGLFAFFNQTNNTATTGTLTATLETSADTTNWTALANYAFTTNQTAVNYTNIYYGGTNLVATNTYLFPGVVTTPTASTAGFATQYLLPNQYTNSGALSLNMNQWAILGVKLDDLQRYVHVIWNPGATVTNQVGCFLIGKGNQIP